MSFDAPIAKSNSVIYQPGGTPSGIVVTTWAEVQAFIAYRQGSCIVYVDDSIVSPALVPAASGVTECFGRVELRPFKIDSINYSVLQVENGATLSNLYQVTDLELRLNCQGATPSLTFSGTATGGFLSLWQYANLTTAATATQPGVSIPAGKTFFVTVDSGAAITGANFADIVTPIFAVPATATLEIAVYNNSICFPNFAQGAGTVNLFYDDSSASFFFPTATPPPIPAFTGTYATSRDSLAAMLLSMPFAFNTASPLLLIPVNAGSILSRAQIQITTPFNDPAATLLFGTAANPSLIMGAADSDPGVADTYDKLNMVTIPANDTLRLTISPGASVQGAGILYYEIRTL